MFFPPHQLIFIISPPEAEGPMVLISLVQTGIYVQRYTDIKSRAKSFVEALKMLNSSVWLILPRHRCSLFSGSNYSISRIIKQRGRKPNNAGKKSMRKTDIRIPAGKYSMRKTENTTGRVRPTGLTKMKFTNYDGRRIVGRKPHQNPTPFFFFFFLTFQSIGASVYPVR